MKLCSTCKLPDKKFHKNAANPDGLQFQCIDCRKIADQARYQRIKPRIVKQNKLNKLRARKYVLEYLSTHPCTDCGEKDPIVLEFDHLDKDKKSFNIGNAVSSGYSIRLLKEEIIKCEVRCANCHRRRTAVQFGWYKDMVEAAAAP